MHSLAYQWNQGLERNPWDDDFTVFVAVPAPDGGPAVFVRVQSQMIMSTHGRAVLYTDMDCGLSAGTPYRVSPQVDTVGRDVFDGRDSLYVVPDQQPIETPRWVPRETRQIGPGLTIRAWH